MFGPTVPGVTCRRTFTDVAKSWPVATTDGGAWTFVCEAARLVDGGSCVRTPVAPNTPAAITSSATTVRRSDPILRSSPATPGTFT